MRAYVKAHIHESKSPLIRKQNEAILKILRDDPNQTANSIAEITGWHKRTVTERLNHLANEGIIQNVRMWIVLDEVEK